MAIKGKMGKRDKIGLGIILAVCLPLIILAWILMPQQLFPTVFCIIIGILACILFCEFHIGTRLPFSWWLGGLIGTSSMIVAFWMVGYLASTTFSFRATIVTQEYMKDYNLRYAPIDGETEIDNNRLHYAFVMNDEESFFMLFVRATEKGMEVVEKIPISTEWQLKPAGWQIKPVKFSAVPGGLEWMLPKGKGMVSKIYLTLSLLRSREKN